MIMSAVAFCPEVQLCFVRCCVLSGGAVVFCAIAFNLSLEFCFDVLLPAALWS